MTDEEDPFGDLGDDLDKDVDPVNDVNQQPTPNTDDVLVNDADDAGRSETDVPAEPAFPFDDAVQQPLYARAESWQQFEDVVDFDVQQSLREAGVRDVPKREIHDAALRVLAEQPEAIVDAVLDERRDQ